MVADNPQEKIELKAFCAEIINDHKALGNDQASYREFPQFSKVETTDVVGNYFKVKNDVAMIVQIEMKE